MKQEEKIREQYDLFIKRFEKRVRFIGTSLAGTDCELCGCKIGLKAFTCFMYPDYSMKALCNPCGAKEKLRLDYSNKN